MLKLLTHMATSSTTHCLTGLQCNNTTPPLQIRWLLKLYPPPKEKKKKKKLLIDDNNKRKVKRREVIGTEGKRQVGLENWKIGKFNHNHSHIKTSLMSEILLKSPKLLNQTLKTRHPKSFANNWKKTDLTHHCKIIIIISWNCDEIKKALHSTHFHFNFFFPPYHLIKDKSVLIDITLYYWLILYHYDWIINISIYFFTLLLMTKSWICIIF